MRSSLLYQGSIALGFSLGLSSILGLSSSLCLYVFFAFGLNFGATSPNSDVHSFTITIKLRFKCAMPKRPRMSYEA
jgi:hypothetical protein